MDARSSTATESTDRALIVTRVFDAPRELMWKALTEPERLERWWGPKGFTSRIHKLELRPGGTFLYSQRNAEGLEMWGKWVYREIIAPERLVFVSSFTDEKGNPARNPFEPNWPLETLGISTFTEDRGPHDGDSADGSDKRDRVGAADFLRRDQIYGRGICRHLGQAGQVPGNALRTASSTGRRRKTMQLNPYLNFNGNCAAAFKFYEKNLGGKIGMMMTFGESPMAEQVPAAHRGKVMHARHDDRRPGTDGIRRAARSLRADEGLLGVSAGRYRGRSGEDLQSIVGEGQRVDADPEDFLG